MFLEPLSAFLIALIIHITKIAYLIRYNKQYSTFLQADGLQYNDTLPDNTSLANLILDDKSHDTNGEKIAQVAVFKYLCRLEKTGMDDGIQTA